MPLSRGIPWRDVLARTVLFAVITGMMVALLITVTQTSTRTTVRKIEREVSGEIARNRENSRHAAAIIARLLAGNREGTACVLTVLLRIAVVAGIKTIHKPAGLRDGCRALTKPPPENPFGSGATVTPGPSPPGG